MAIALVLSKEPVHWEDIPGLTRDLAAAYANSRRMLQRDLNVLNSMELVRCSDDALVPELVRRLRSVCSAMPDDTFEAMIRDIACTRLRWD